MKKMHLNKKLVEKLSIIVLLLTFLRIYVSKQSTMIAEQSKQSQIIAKQSPTFVLYNRVPKCGSSFFKTLLRPLCTKNNFMEINSEKYPLFQQIIQRQTAAELAKTKKKIETLENKTMFVEHTQFVNLKSPKVAYINLIRDPLQRVNSAYRFTRDITKPYGQTIYEQVRNKKQNETLAHKWLTTPLGQCIQETSIKSPTETFCRNRGRNRYSCCLTTYQSFVTIKYFCGSHSVCRNPDSNAAVNRAIANINEFYSVVGVLEKMDKTVEVLEKVMSEFFNGAVKRYEDMMKEDDHVVYKTMSDLKILENPQDPAYQVLKNHLRREYQLYDFVVRKLERQAELVKMGTLGS